MRSRRTLGHVVGLEDEEWGEVVAAPVTTSSETALETEALREDCREHLDPATVPKLVEGPTRSLERPRIRRTGPPSGSGFPRRADAGAFKNALRQLPAVCTLVIAWQVLIDAPVAVAANRDEALDRPSEPPAVTEGDPAIVAPRDGQAGGTWLGYNDRGLLVGLSNRWTDAEPEGERSRGLLVRDLLGTESADAAASQLEEAVRAHGYEPFNLVVADATSAMVFEWDERLRVTDLSPGVHVVLNAGWDDRFTAVDDRDELVERQVESAHRLRRLLAVEPDETAEDWLDRAGLALADHDLGVCVHREGFGTRSSSLIALRDGGATYRFADGPPCDVDYAAVEAQI